MKIQLSEHFSYRKLLRFTFPTIIMMIFTSIYGVVDGIFVSNFAGKIPFAAVNFIMPFLMIFGAVGFMLGTGGSAIVAKTMGEGEQERANRYFSMIIYTAAAVSLLLTVIGEIALPTVAALLGAEDEMLTYCIQYGRIILITLTAFILQNVFQSFLVTAEQPTLGLILTVAAGLTNIVMDYLLVGVLHLGIAGAAIATCISQCIGGILPLLYFLLPNKSPLKLVCPSIDWRVLGKACGNGSSEMMTNLSMSLVNMLYNFQLMRLVGEDGIAAFGVIMYVNFIFISVFVGYAIGSAPIVGYHFGAKHAGELHGLLKKSLVLTTISGIVLTGLSLTLSMPLAKIFVGYDASLLILTVRGFRIYTLSFLFAGYNIFASSFFTALNNGWISALISFLRTCLFQIAAIFLLPLILDVDGIWAAIIAAELLGLCVSAACLIGNRKKYQY